MRVTVGVMVEGEVEGEAGRLSATRRGSRTVADQLLRAGTSTVLLIAEGANRYTAFLAVNGGIRISPSSPR